MIVSILVPYTSGCEHRARARDYVLAHYATHHPDWALVEGACPPPWSKGAALADAALRADGDVLVIADADSFTTPEVLTEAARIVTDGEAAWVVPHHKVLRLHHHRTAAVLNGATAGRAGTCRAPYPGVVGGGITVVSRQAWDAVGGIDPRFLGWGGEDMAFGWALETLCGPCTRLDGLLWHLWHPPEVKGPKKRGSPEAEALAGRYRRALGNPDEMRTLIDEIRPHGQDVLTLLRKGEVIVSGSDPTDDPDRDHHAA